jgi:hypothetical protein
LTDKDTGDKDQKESFKPVQAGFLLAFTQDLADLPAKNCGTIGNHVWKLNLHQYGGLTQREWVYASMRLL